eukprot:CAMPEP_0170493150 /NCGR_PEP_ID=MMETSP0208-20121228/13439_1 /TAXON_ID=197538 /ORGANISM="Strombidium inclinatum, Strain S3" /LENGTH=67 /DNA_ID=CAMNT_0010769033 /DNA_START=296 /DNA_END=499 /DNA_ORIENTATION=-
MKSCDWMYLFTGGLACFWLMLNCFFISWLLPSNSSSTFFLGAGTTSGSASKLTFLGSAGATDFFHSL